MVTLSPSFLILYQHPLVNCLIPNQMLPHMNEDWNETQEDETSEESLSGMAVTTWKLAFISFS